MFVTRKDDSVAVWDSSGTKRQTFVATTSGKDAEYTRYAVSASAGLYVEISRTAIVVKDVSTGKQAWSSPLDMTVWGPPAFTPDGSRLAIPLSAHVMMLDARTGKEQRPLGADPGNPERTSGHLTLPRRIYYSPDSARAAIVCESNRESSANHTVFVADVKTGAITQSLVAAHDSGISDVAWAGKAIVSVDVAGTVRVFEQGAIRRELRTGRNGALGVTEDASTLAIIGEGRIGLWSGGAYTEAPANAGWPAYIYAPTATSVRTLDGDGKIVDHPRPTASTKIVMREWSDAEARAWDAVWALGREGSDAVDAAIAALTPVADREPVFRAALAIAKRIAAGATSFRTTSPDETVAALAAAETYNDGGFLDLALFAYSGWLGGHLAAARPTDEVARGIALGTAMATSFSLSNDEDGEAQILTWMLRAWPQREDVVEAYAEGLRYAERDKVIATLEAFLAKTPSDKLTRLLADIRADN